jgi:hypothetical protein
MKPSHGPAEDDPNAVIRRPTTLTKVNAWKSHFSVGVPSGYAQASCTEITIRTAASPAIDCWKARILDRVGTFAPVRDRVPVSL